MAFVWPSKALPPQITTWCLANSSLLCVLNTTISLFGQIDYFYSFFSPYFPLTYWHPISITLFALLGPLSYYYFFANHFCIFNIFPFQHLLIWCLPLKFNSFLWEIYNSIPFPVVSFMQAFSSLLTCICWYVALKKVLSIFFTCLCFISQRRL